MLLTQFFFLLKLRKFKKFSKMQKYVLFKKLNIMIIQHGTGNEAILTLYVDHLGWNIKILR